MSNGIARLSDIGSGHGCYPSRNNITASLDVFVDGRGAHRFGDVWAPHSCSGKTHSGVLITGSTTVFVNNRPVGRIGDVVSCGSTIITGSVDVFSG